MSARWSSRRRPPSRTNTVACSPLSDKLASALAAIKRSSASDDQPSDIRGCQPSSSRMWQVSSLPAAAAIAEPWRVRASTAPRSCSMKVRARPELKRRMCSMTRGSGSTAASAFSSRKGICRISSADGRFSSLKVSMAETQSLAACDTEPQYLTGKCVHRPVSGSHLPSSLLSEAARFGVPSAPTTVSYGGNPQSKMKAMTPADQMSAFSLKGLRDKISGAM
mmetsp:Transcript_17806/g.41925  ORF Transcript_17806/g.41925 Transcript_17806/m.41925 type:complete len:222 (+) Transcript_17806:1473-2138(+)